MLLAGCGAGRTLVMAPPNARVQVASVEVTEGPSTVTVPDDVRLGFQHKLQDLLYRDGPFGKGHDLRLSYRFIQFNPGNQFTRWFSGGIGNAGEGSLTVEVKYFDGASQELSTIQAEGKIGSGFFGGPFELAVWKAAEEIADYTTRTFR
jgi:hypothetical protein